MKTYNDTIETIAKECFDGDLRYVKWAVGKTISVAYEVDADKVFTDVKAVMDRLENNRKAEQKKRKQEENEKRRLANIARRENV